MGQSSKGLRQSTIKRNNDRNNPFSKNQKRSYFDNQESRAGSNWLLNKDDNTLRREVKGIIRDIVNQNVDIETHAHYFTEMRIIQALINECNAQYKRWFVRAEMSTFYTNILSQNRQPIHQDYVAVNYEDRILSDLYLQLYQTFINIAQSQNANLHLNNLYNWLGHNNGRYFMDDDIPEFVRNNLMYNSEED